MRSIILSILFILAGCSVYAQGEFSGGFKAGLNFNNFDAPTENANESFSNKTGFHIGISMVYSLTDIFGLKGELMYSQKGTQYDYSGDSYFTFYTTGANAGIPIYATGKRDANFAITNTYIDLPVLVYARLGIVEFEAGVNAGVLVSSRGSGALTFSGTTLTGSAIEEFTTNLDMGYYSSEQGASAIESGANVTINTIGAVLPSTINAYYEAADNDDKRYKTLDFGLNAGVAVYINSGLYLGFRANYGLTDVSNEAQDLSLEKLNINGAENPYIKRDDVDRNLSIQTSVGFRF